MDSNRTKTKKDLFEDLLYLALFLLFIVVSADQLMVMLQAKKAFGYEYVIFLALGIFSVGGFLRIGKGCLSGLMKKPPID